MIGGGTAASVVDPLGVLWGKSNAGGRVNLLLQHLLDTAAVAECMWDDYLAPTLKDKIDRCSDGRGRAFFALVCGLHDVGKASPAFQSKVPELATRVRDAGLSWGHLDPQSLRWHHSRAGAVVCQRVLPLLGWNPEAVGWVWPLVGGHHGEVPRAGELISRMRRGEAQGRGAWLDAQEALIRRVAAELDVDIAAVAPARCPRRAEQLAIAGAVIMADWIASNDRFGGVDQLEKVSMAAARERAALGWESLDIHGGWNPSRLPVHLDPVAMRFGYALRPAQADAVALAEQMSAPGLLILEAPMGEGKTEAALAAAEVLSRRFGADGVFVGMPTQATSDPMFSRVRRWTKSVDAAVPVGLLHGKRRFNREWKALQARVDFEGVDEFGCDDDPYGSDHLTARTSSREIPAEWFLGPKRGLLAPVTVGTIDHLLHAATRTRHVMLRHAGLAGRVVVLDEVHAYDVYMSQFLFEALRWLADAGVPVVLLSATLPPAQREELVRAYLQGVLQERDVALPELDAMEGYPAALAVCAAAAVEVLQRESAPWRSSAAVRVEVLDEPADGGADDVLAVLEEALQDGGCALVVRNTVARAQETFARVRQVFGEDAVLLHARLTAGARAERTERVLDLLGPPGRRGGAVRPRRLVVVATQLAEQSFDSDFDLLVTDLAPIDLLLQRAGRLHRHDRPAGDRPERVRSPRVLVTGMSRHEGRAPDLPRGSSYVYGTDLLLRAAALVLVAVGTGGWSIPAQVPALVAAGYAEDAGLPPEWSDAAAEAQRDWHEQQQRRRAQAETFLLAGEDKLGSATLAGLHDRATADLNDEERVAAVVRDGEESVEVVLVRREARGYLTLGGEPLGPNGDAVSDPAVLERVIESTVRLPAQPQLSAVAKQELAPLPGWRSDPWLRRARALVLDEVMSTHPGSWSLRYDHELGLLAERER